MKNENKLLLKTAAEDFFGLAVAIDNDLIVVGSPFDDDKGSESGSVYVFSKKNRRSRWLGASVKTDSQ